MTRWLIPLFLLLAPAAAHANPQFDVAVALQALRAGRDGDALYYLDRAIASRAIKGSALAGALEWRAFLTPHTRGRRA